MPGHLRLCNEGGRRVTSLVFLLPDSDDHRRAGNESDGYSLQHQSKRFVGFFNRSGNFSNFEQPERMRVLRDFNLQNPPGRLFKFCAIFQIHLKKAIRDIQWSDEPRTNSSYL